MVGVTPPPSLALLSDEQIRRFIAQGFLVLKSRVPRDVNQSIRRSLDESMDRLGDLGNNVYPQVPLLQEVFRDPVVRGALTSVLGPGYLMHAHRYAHRTAPGAEQRQWHKDTYWGYARKVRNQRPWWAMVMYYPQDVRLEHGPTAVMPGRQHYLQQPPDDPPHVARATGEAGTFLLVHYDQWHQASANTSDITRFMLKFQFLRTAAPTAPPWDGSGGDWRDPAGDPPPCPHRTTWRHVWNWSSGRSPDQWHAPSEPGRIGDLVDRLTHGDERTRADAADQLGMRGQRAGDAVAALAAAVHDEKEPVIMNACQALAAIGAPAVEPLAKALHSPSDLTRRHAASALGTLGPAAIGSLLDAVRSQAEVPRALAAAALGEAGVADHAVVDALGNGLRDANAWVRLCAADALGMLGAPAAPATGALTVAMCRDQDTEVRFTAARALARFGPAGAEATDALVACLEDPNRYVRAYAIEALHRIGSPRAIDALLEHLKASRWCPVTALVHPFKP